ncbi:MAG TPA: transcriptional regulator [Desulfovibrio sp.]|nr:transcriptional regulator [Desulfovibrio sp.]
MSMSALLRVSSGSEADIMAGYHYPFMSSVSGPYFMLNGLNAPFWEKISQARAQFHSGQDNHFPHVRPNILRSWQRSRNANVPPVGLPLAMVGAEEFQAVLARHTTLVDTASRIMEELLENILPSKSCIVLTDADGVFLHTIGDGEGYGQGSCCLLRGIISRESVDGTTSMGMCLEEKIPVCVLGSEHYNPHYDGWSCAAAPIYDNEGELVGTLSLTLERDKFHQHTFGLVIAAAKAITEQMRLRMLLQEVQTVMELLGEAVVVLDAGGSLRLMNRYAKRLFRVRGDVLGRDFSSIATDASGKNPAFTGKKVKDGECSMLLADGTSLHCLFSSSPIPGGGLCITLRETRRVHALTNRLSGAKAVYDFGDIIGDSDAMGQALHLARMASGNSMTTLLLGESGVGKELFAQAIHNGGERRQEPFIVVNCGAIPRDLVQSELFGYEAGSFTGAAHQGAPGKFELADGGTLFLDEIGDMPQTAQISLLRVLQEGEVTRIGGKRPTRVDVRVVAATHRDLALAVAKGTFRQDLFYRLNVFVIQVPPLRLRQGDIPALARFFLNKISKTLRKPLTGFTPAALASLEGYAWPGNVRELENLVERTAVVAKGPHIDAEDLPPEIRQDQTGDATSRRAASLTPEATAAADRTGQGREAIVAALRLTRGNVRAAAKSIGVTRATLYARILRLGLDVRDFRDAG